MRLTLESRGEGDLLNVLNADEVDAHGGDGEADADVDEHDDEVLVLVGHQVPEPNLQPQPAPSSVPGTEGGGGRW